MRSTRLPDHTTESADILTTDPMDPPHPPEPDVGSDWEVLGEESTVEVTEVRLGTKTLTACKGSFPHPSIPSFTRLRDLSSDVRNLPICMQSSPPNPSTQSHTLHFPSLTCCSYGHLHLQSTIIRQRTKLRPTRWILKLTDFNPLYRASISRLRRLISVNVCAFPQETQGLDFNHSCSCWSPPI